MARKRYINSDISTDPKVADLAAFGTLPLLLYTWAILHADDWGRMTGDPRQFRLLVCPALDVTAKDIELALDQIASVGLWERYEIDGRFYIAFPEESWFKYQSYISKEKRNAENGRKGSTFPAPNSTKQHQTEPSGTNHNQIAPNTAESHLAVVGLPSPSPSPTPSKQERENAHARVEDVDDEEIDESQMTDAELAVSRLSQFHKEQKLLPRRPDRAGDEIRSIGESYPPKWILEAIEVMKKSDGNSLTYLDRILLSWKNIGQSPSEQREERSDATRGIHTISVTRTNQEPSSQYGHLRGGRWKPPEASGGG